MLFHILLGRNTQLHPRHFGHNLSQSLSVQTYERYLRALLMQWGFFFCSGRHGFVVAIMGVESIGTGLIRDGIGFVTFPVRCQCIVFRPFRGEILGAAVTMVNKVAFFNASEAGAVQIFLVSNHLIPDDMELQTGDLPNYTTSDGSVCISF
ncbi:DNA-directed RNA polymerase II 19 kDa polypeptide [Citrus sinensis]|nr:DNA-directed RNA polymerase II 19 kDa polypeptide [Citrus sinensis]